MGLGGLLGVVVCMKNAPHKLMYLNTRSPVHDDILGNFELLKFEPY